MMDGSGSHKFSDRHVVLATGGAGYIGSHTVVELSKAGYDVVILDNFENSERTEVPHIPRLKGAGDVCLVEGDARNAQLVENIISRHGVSAVIHFAGKKSISEAVRDPILYYQDNLSATLGVISGMSATGCSRLVFSSSAMVYGNADVLPTPETAPTHVTNAYGRTKLFAEQMIDDLVESILGFRALSLRYFNPVGAHSSGLIGENPKIPNNLFPYVAQTAAGLRERVSVFGSDYDTIDGSGSRDYIHVVDLARGHVAAVDFLFRNESVSGIHQRVNLGTGKGHTVLQVLRAFSEACGREVPFELVGRRKGDAAASLADNQLAKQLLGWEPIYGLREMCHDHWNFQKGLSAGRTISTILS